jgi:DNA-binding MarR family transcriptional regulator
MSISDEIKQSSFKNEETKAVINLIFTGNFLVQRQQAFMKPFGITMQQFNVLRILEGQKGQASSVLLITERMLDKMSNASRLVDKLFAKKLVSRVQCEKDRRAVDVYILPAGSALIKQIEVNLEEFRKQVGQLGEENLKQLNELLDQFRARIS